MALGNSKLSEHALEVVRLHHKHGGDPPIFEAYQHVWTERHPAVIDKIYPTPSLPSPASPSPSDSPSPLTPTSTASTATHQSLSHNVDQSFPIFVRDVYVAIAEWLETSEYGLTRSDLKKSCLGIIGQAGTGKSLALRYLLLRSFEAKRIVVFVPDPDAQMLYLFAEDGAYYLRVDVLDEFALPPNVLILCDSGRSLNPPPARLDSGAAKSSFLVFSTLPQRSRYSEWLKQRSGYAWEIDLVKREEIEGMMRLRNYSFDIKEDVYSPLEIHDYVGPSARHCFERRIAKGGDLLHDLLPGLDVSAIVSTSTAFAKAMIDKTLAEHSQGQGFHRFFFEEPEGPQPSHREPRYTLGVPTSFLRNTIRQAFRHATLRDRLVFAGNISLGPSMKGFAYEGFAIDFLSLAPHNIYNVIIRDSRRTYSLNTPAPHHLRSLPSSAPTDVIGGMYVPTLSYPSLDAVLVDLAAQPPRLTILQVTYQSRHTSNDVGIENVIKLFANVPLDTEWAFVFVVPSDDVGLSNVNSRTGLLARKGVREGMRSKKRERDTDRPDISVGHVVLEDNISSWKEIAVRAFGSIV